MRVLVLAYACEPGKGSEPGAGWIFSRMLGQVSEAWVITRANNRPAIEEALQGRAPEVRFSYVDLPPWARRWKKGQRGVRLYYILWQFAALRRARKLHREVSFDCVWHLTLANAWLGSVGGFVGPPFVYGPLGGGVRPPLRLLPTFGWRGIAYEVTREALRTGSRYLNVLARMAWRRARVILVQNPETANWFPARHRPRTMVFQHAVVEKSLPAARVDREGPPTALLAARLLPWKGGALAIAAIARNRKWRLIVCGSGPDEQRLRGLTTELGIEDRVDFRGQMSQERLFSTLTSETDVFLFPSLHDDSPLAVAEAASTGLPIVCLDVGGPHLIAGPNAVTVDSRRSRKAVIADLGEALDRAYESRGRVGRRDELLMSNRREELKQLLHRVVGEA